MSELTGDKIPQQDPLMLVANEPEFKARLKGARIAAGLNQSELARKCGVGPATINHLESGRSTAPSAALLLSLALTLDVNPTWLQTGYGVVRIPTPKGSDNEHLGLIRALRLAEIGQFAKNNALDENNIEHPIRVGAEALTYMNLEGDQNTTPGPDLTGKVPLISWVQAGTWHHAEDPYQVGDAEDWLYYPKKNGDRVYALRVRGDSMTANHGRSYPDGSIIFVDPARCSPTSGDRVIAKLDGVDEVTFKVFVCDGGRCWLKALNADYPPITDRFMVIGTVTGMFISE